MEKYGIKELKEAFDLGFAAVSAGRCAWADNKITLGDVVCVIPLFPKIEPGVQDIALALKELADLDEAEEQELLVYAKDKLSVVLQDEQIKKVALAVIKVGLSLAEAVSLLKKDA